MLLMQRNRNLLIFVDISSAVVETSSLLARTMLVTSASTPATESGFPKINTGHIFSRT